MSTDILDGMKAYTTGEKLPAEDMNTTNEHIVMSAFKSLIAGENITKGDVVYLKSSDGKAYISIPNDAGTPQARAFIGLALEDATIGTLVDIQVSGVFEKRTGLSTGSTYYKSDTTHVISTTPSTTFPERVGIALSPQHLLILPYQPYNSGTTTKNAADASTTQNIAHGLGKIPKFVKVTAIFGGADGAGAHAFNFAMATYNGTTMSAIYMAQGAAGTVVQGVQFILNTANLSASQEGIITFDATNIIITWTRNGSPTGTYQLLWEAEG